MKITVPTHTRKTYVDQVVTPMHRRTSCTFIYCVQQYSKLKCNCILSTLYFVVIVTLLLEIVITLFFISFRMVIHRIKYVWQLFLENLNKLLNALDVIILSDRVCFRCTIIMFEVRLVLVSVMPCKYLVKEHKKYVFA